MLTVKKAEHTTCSGQVRQPLIRIGCRHPALGMIQKQSVLLTTYLCPKLSAERHHRLRAPSITSQFLPVTSKLSISCKLALLRLLAPQSSQAASRAWTSGQLLQCRPFHVPVPSTCTGSATPAPGANHSCHLSRPCFLALKACGSKVHGFQSHAVRLIASPLFCSLNSHNIGYFRAWAGTSRAQKTQ